MLTGTNECTCQCHTSDMVSHIAPCCCSHGKKIKCDECSWDYTSRKTGVDTQEV